MDVPIMSHRSSSISSARNPPSDRAYTVYQMQTFGVLAIAFLASHVYSLRHLRDRTNR
jgi:hypothetical protein